MRWCNDCGVDAVDNDDNESSWMMMMMMMMMNAHG
jgi:hypothetical protein